MTQTRFYRHYKNKPYRLLGTAHHSETQEELALYETLYDNPTGRIWVRPKKMFFEKVMVNGREQARFALVEFNFQVSDQPSAVIAELAKASLGSFDIEKFESKVKAHSHWHFVTAWDGDNPVGFKCGYAQGKTVFYSWLGGVIPEYRGLGIASRLMELQHGWCRERGYETVETRTKNQFPEMISLNLRRGFRIAGTTGGAEIKILMEKTL